jgi:flagellar biosynthesis/type III secretory pathway chaperone
MSRVDDSLSLILSEQIRCAEAMLGTLSRENEALVAGDADELNAAGAEKARLVEALEALETERRNLAAVIEATFKGETATAGSQWQTLLELVAECKRANQSNGALVRARGEQVRAALGIVRGAESALYDGNGTAAAGRSARPLGTA